MSCRSAINRAPDATMTEPRHVLRLADYDAETGCAPCQECGALVTRARWLEETCPGKKEPT